MEIKDVDLWEKIGDLYDFEGAASIMWWRLRCQPNKIVGCRICI